MTMGGPASTTPETSRPGRFLSLNGRIVPYEQAVIHVASVAMKYGASVFEGIRGYWREADQTLVLLALDRHLRRLFDSMRLMGMDHDFDRDQVTRYVHALVAANRLTMDCYIRVAASIDVDGPISSTGPVLLNISAFPMGRKPIGDRSRLMVSSWRRIADEAMPARIKCVANYQNGRLATLTAQHAGFDNALLLTGNGKVSETPTAALFIVRDGVLCTPPVTADILESITRRLVLTVAVAMEIPCVERVIDRSECYLADEAFLCGTGAEILGVRAIDQYELVSPGLVTTRIRETFFDIAYGRDDSYQHWVSPLPLSEMQHASDE